jgi:mitochondrial division protein 1
MASATANAASRRAIGSSGMGSSRLDFATLGRAPLRLGLGARRLTSRDLQIVEATDELLEEDIPEPDGVASDVSLLRGFNATIPSSEKARARRRQTRNVETPRLGLKKLGMGSRGLLVDDEEHDHESVASEDDMVLVGSSAGKSQKAKTKRKGRTSLSAGVSLGKDELVRQTHEIERDKENLHVRRVSTHIPIALRLRSSQNTYRH